MERFTALKALAAVLDRPNVDTDLMVPKQFLTRIERAGFGEVLFNNIRYREDGTPVPAFILNQPRFQGARILVSRENFGCGSSREPAPWALEDYGFKVLISPRFADIFKSNCGKIGLVTIELEPGIVDELIKRIMATPGYELSVYLGKQTGKGESYEAYFDYDPFRKEKHLNGWDDISLTLNLDKDTAAYESAHQELWKGGALQSHQA